MSSYMYTLLGPGLERRLAYAEYTRNTRNTHRRRQRVSTSGTYTPSTSTTYDNEYINTVYRLEQSNSQNTLRNLLLKTTIVINKEKHLCCAICQDDILQDTEIIRKLECNHVYHIHCIDKWFIVKLECPICKHVI